MKVYRNPSIDIDLNTVVKENELENHRFDVAPIRSATLNRCISVKFQNFSEATMIGSSKSCIVIKKIGISNIEDLPIKFHLYFPKEEEIVQKLGEWVFRYMYSGEIKYTNEEIATIHNFLKIIKKKFKTKLAVMDWVKRQPHSFFLKLLYSKKMDMVASIKAQPNCHKFMTKYDNMPLTDRDIETLFKSGIIYSYGRDHCFRPIFIINVHRLNDLFSKNKNLRSKIVYQFFIKFFKKNFVVEGKIENFILIIDQKTISKQNLSFNHFNKVTKLLHRSPEFTTAIYRCYILNNDYSILKIVLEFTHFSSNDWSKKFIVTQKNSDIKMWNHISKNQMEKKYGGNVDDLEKDFWPCRIPNYNFFQTDEYENERLVTIEEYYRMYKNGYFNGSGAVVC